MLKLYNSFDSLFSYAFIIAGNDIRVKQINYNEFNDFVQKEEVTNSVFKEDFNNIHLLQIKDNYFLLKKTNNHDEGILLIDFFNDFFKSNQSKSFQNSITLYRI